MKNSQLIFLGLALFLVVQSSASFHRCNFDLGPGIDGCTSGCSEIEVKPVHPIRPVRYVDPHLIKETTVVKPTPVSGGCGCKHPPQHNRGPFVTSWSKSNKGPIAPRFHPVGDLCSCTKTFADVIPANPGPPVCSLTPKVKHPCDSPSYFADSVLPSVGFSSISSARQDLNSFDDDCLSFDEQEDIYNSQPAQAIPADPVSLALAYSLAKQATSNVPESSLSFGAKKTPVDGSRSKSHSDIPEEKLLIVEQPVVELRLTPKSVTTSTHEQVIAQQEALEQQRIELEAQAEETPTQEPGVISYNALGYVPVRATGHNFVSTVTTVDASAPEEAVDDCPCGSIGKPLPGYVSGNVIVRSTTVRKENLKHYAEDSYEGDDGEDEDHDEYHNEDHDEDQSGYYSHEDSTPYPRHGGLLARLRASAHAQTGCGCGYH